MPPPEPLSVSTVEEVAEISEACNFIARKTIGEEEDTSATPIVGQADATEILTATEGMKFATIFETDDAAMTWTEDLDIT